MSEIINISASENIISFVADYIVKSGGACAVVSGGKRPSLFLKKALFEKLGKPFLPPRFFTNESFIEYFAAVGTYLKISDIEAAYVIFEITKRDFSPLLKGRKRFAQFLPWAFEILSFIEQLDLENVSEERLKNIKANADIGYDVPENINELLKNIFQIRNSFHKICKDANRITKGMTYLKAAKAQTQNLKEHFDKIILLAPFYLHKSELEVYKKIYDLGKLTVVIQGDPSVYGELSKIYEYFGEKIPVWRGGEKTENDLQIFSAYDGQSQGLLLKNLLADLKEEELSKTAVIVPLAKELPSIISEISSLTQNYNVSAGYPASKTSVFALINSIIQAQLSRKGGRYYAKDAIAVLTNPLVKNMRFFADASVTRIAAHKIERSLSLSSKTALSGKIFFEFNEIYENEELIQDVCASASQAWKPLGKERVIETLKEIFNLLFCVWEKADTLFLFSQTLESFLRELTSYSVAQSYPLNAQSASALLDAAKSLKSGEASQMRFEKEDVLNIFKTLISNIHLSLPGSPLKGLQVLGFLEARNLSFENVFIVSMTDSALPAAKKESPLIPKDIMFALGIEMAKKELEIQKYHFQRITAGAKKVRLIYPQNSKEERSRFIEKLIWQKQFSSNGIDAVKVKSLITPEINAKKEEKRKYKKTDEIKSFLKNLKYSNSKIDAYLRCGLEFYFRYVLGLDEADVVGEEASSADIGIFIHNFLRTVFHRGFKREELKGAEFKKFYLQELSGQFDGSFNLKLREDAFLIKKVLDYRLENFLEREKEREYDFIEVCEKKYLSEIETQSGLYKLECVIDRVDAVGKDRIILDYKTGSVPERLIKARFEEITSELSRKNIKKAAESLQLPLYKYIFEKEEKSFVSSCCLYDVKKGALKEFPMQEGEYEKCVEMIKFILDEINGGDFFEFDADDAPACKTCKYFYLCR
ncbi:MAG: PD-(D/E)XK nuclease family protein [Endomicrobium sp.]|jgi:CRISPR/Cas system-associated exonuclease Cas4 (RecB family)|nr:PD-(D/E)XK nuclease family protein [Endomicrobium sp.]